MGRRPVNESELTHTQPGASSADPYRIRAICVSVLFGLTLPANVALLFLAQPARPVPEPPMWSAEAVALGVQPVDITKGQFAFRSACAVCHGEDANGLHLLGKPLRNSAFVQSQTDEELLSLLISGRPISAPENTSGVLMPPRGAQDLDDDSLKHIVLYLRAIQDVNAPTVSTEAWNFKSEDGTSIAGVELTDHAGYGLYMASCAACHGTDAGGMEGLGLPLSTSGFVRAQSDKDLITFIKTGRPIWDANNTTGLDMPPKGGNPAITDEQLQGIVDYLRAVQDKAMGS